MKKCSAKEIKYDIIPFTKFCSLLVASFVAGFNSFLVLQKGMEACLDYSAVDNGCRS